MAATGAVADSDRPMNWACRRCCERLTRYTLYPSRECVDAETVREEFDATVSDFGNDECACDGGRPCPLCWGVAQKCDGCGRQTCVDCAYTFDSSYKWCSEDANYGGQYCGECVNDALARGPYACTSKRRVMGRWFSETTSDCGGDGIIGAAAAAGTAVNKRFVMRDYYEMPEMRAAIEAALA